MTRNYTLKRRAEQQAETRRRIVEAAFDLHGSVGPARTTISMIAERAGVQRHTLYAHFPDERSLFAACSGLLEEQVRCRTRPPGAASRTRKSGSGPDFERSMAGTAATPNWSAAYFATLNTIR
jgi:AcrR family transcriptional regulator